MTERAYEYRVLFDQAKGADFAKSFVLQSAPGVARNLTGATFQLAVDRRDGTSQAVMTIGDGITIQDAAAGRIDLRINKTVLALWPAGVYVHELMMTQSGTTSRVWTGTLTLVESLADD